MWPAQMARIAYDRFHFADAAPGHPFGSCRTVRIFCTADGSVGFSA